MRFPKELNILGYKVTVKRIDQARHPDTPFSGLFESDKDMVINIDKKMGRDEQWSTLLHEIIEALKCIQRLKLSHLNIEKLETGLFQVLKDNKLRFF